MLAIGMKNNIFSEKDFFFILSKEFNYFTQMEAFLVKRPKQVLSCFNNSIEYRQDKLV